MGRKKGVKVKLSPFSQSALRRKQLEDAVAWCVLKGKGAHACLTHARKENKWELVKKSALQSRLNGHVKMGAEHEKRQVLTNDEEKELVDWLIEANKHQQAKNQADVKAKVIELLMHRQHMNRTNHKKGGRGHINDPSRVLNKDETPQFIDYESTKSGQNKVFCARGENAYATHSETRDCQTVDVTWGLDGWQYHLHLVVAKKEVTTDFVQTETLIFDGSMDDVNKCSRVLLISPTEKGSQTQVSILETLKQLKAELEARKVPFPVVLCSDNHSSRYGDDVLEWCENNGIEFFFEESNSSGFLQALDQYNRQLHLSYEKAKKVYKEGRARYISIAQGGTKVDPKTIRVNLVDFVISVHGKIEGRVGHSAALIGSRMYVFGGWTDGGKFSSDTFVLETSRARRAFIEAAKKAAAFGQSKLGQVADVLSKESRKPYRERNSIGSLECYSPCQWWRSKRRQSEA